MDNKQHEECEEIAGVLSRMRKRLNTMRVGSDDYKRLARRVHAVQAALNALEREYADKEARLAATPAHGETVPFDADFLFDLIRHARTFVRQRGIKGDDYHLNHEARTLALRYEKGDFDKAMKMCTAIQNGAARERELSDIEKDAITRLEADTDACRAAGVPGAQGSSPCPATWKLSEAFALLRLVKSPPKVIVLAADTVTTPPGEVIAYMIRNGHFSEPYNIAMPKDVYVVMVQNPEGRKTFKLKLGNTEYSMGQVRDALLEKSSMEALKLKPEDFMPFRAPPPPPKKVVDLSENSIVEEFTKAGGYHSGDVLHIQIDQYIGLRTSIELAAREPGERVFNVTINNTFDDSKLDVYKEAAKSIYSGEVGRAVMHKGHDPKPAGTGITATVLATQIGEALIADGWRDPPVERVSFGPAMSKLLRRTAADFLNVGKPDSDAHAIDDAYVGRKIKAAFAESVWANTRFTREDAIQAVMTWIKRGVPDRLEIPHDILSHQSAWRSALVGCKEFAEFLTRHTPSNEEDAIANVSYWEHELKAFDNAYAQLRATPMTHELKNVMDYADKFHSGGYVDNSKLGLIGLREGEIPAILRRGEPVVRPVSNASVKPGEMPYHEEALRSIARNLGVNYEELVRTNSQSAPLMYTYKTSRGHALQATDALQLLIIGIIDAAMTIGVISGATDPNHVMALQSLDRIVENAKQEKKESTTDKMVRSYALTYKDYVIEVKQDFGDKPFLIDGLPCAWGYIVTRNGCNAMPGAIWFQTVQKAKEACDILDACTTHGALLNPHVNATEFYRLLKLRATNWPMISYVVIHSAETTEITFELRGHLEQADGDEIVRRITGALPQ